MDKIQKHELKEMNYAEFGALLEKLTRQLQASGIKFDLVVPILRSGGITGMHIASKLKIKNVLPAQYKYIQEPHVELVKKFDFPALHFKVPEQANILVVDSNTVEGKTAKHVVVDVRRQYPTAKIYFASAVTDVGCRVEGVEQQFTSQQSNEARTLSPERAAASGVSNDVAIFPWENLEEQWQEIQAMQQ